MKNLVAFVLLSLVSNYLLFSFQPSLSLSSLSVSPSKGLDDVISSLEELQRNEMLTLKELENYKISLQYVQIQLKASKMELQTLSEQAKDVYKQSQMQLTLLDKSERKLRIWRGIAIGSAVLSIAAIVTTIIVVTIK